MAYTTIKKPSDYFNTKLYTGTGSSQSITGVGFQPDWTWVKARSINYDQNLFDAIRGTEKRLKANATSAEDTVSGSVTAFGTDGFTVGSDAGVNANTETFVAWNWLGANGTASNTDGSITSTVSANTTSGFSIVSFTGTGATATVGHGLGVKPDLIIAKNRTDAVDWYVYHSSLGATKNLRLNQTFAELTESAVWDNTEPTTSVISVNNANGTNGSSKNLIFYCFAEKKGFSKFGSYVGNANNDGPFCFTGFKPALVIKKRAEFGADYRGNWQIHDNKRGEYFPGNVVNNRIDHTNNAESGGDDLGFDFLSNGFKVRTGNVNYNPSGEKVIYIAFAESPFVTSTGIPTTAK